MIQNYINHIALVVDSSGSMYGLADTVVKVFDKEIDYLKRRSVELDQETRISVYTFNRDIACLVFDMDVMRMKSLRNHYFASGQTALIDASIKAINDMEKLPQLYGDNAFLVYVLTDGEENASRHSSSRLTSILDKLPDNWTIACMVPSTRGVHEAKKFGFPTSNIQIWNTSNDGMVEVGASFRSAMDNYMDNRSKGIRGTKNFFSLDTSGIKVKDASANLTKLSANKYTRYQVKAGTAGFVVIKDSVEDATGKSYVKGSTFYELTKTEMIQSYKEICIQDRKSTAVYSGANARTLLGLPNSDVKVSPDKHSGWRIFVQSTSVNRKLPHNSYVLVMN